MWWRDFVLPGGLEDEYDIENGFMQGIGVVDKVKLGNYNLEEEE
ncbi:MAG: hypothetical protein ACOC6I_03245 [Candidatus Bipolaricaulota bacterium]